MLLYPKKRLQQNLKVKKEIQFYHLVLRHPKVFSAILPKISGSTIKKEKRAAFSRSIPNNTAVAIVDPLLENSWEDSNGLDDT